MNSHTGDYAHMIYMYLLHLIYVPIHICIYHMYHVYIYIYICFSVHTIYPSTNPGFSTEITSLFEV